VHVFYLYLVAHVNQYTPRGWEWLGLAGAGHRDSQPRTTELDGTQPRQSDTGEVSGC
jgi:hypothetical protein